MGDECKHLEGIDSDCGFLNRLVCIEGKESDRCVGKILIFKFCVLKGNRHNGCPDNLPSYLKPFLVHFAHVATLVVLRGKLQSTRAREEWVRCGLLNLQSLRTLCHKARSLSLTHLRNHLHTVKIKFLPQTNNLGHPHLLQKL